MRRRPAPILLTSVLLAVPLMAGCSGSSEDDVRSAAEAFLEDWAAGETEAAAGATTDPAVATALLEQTAGDLPGAVLSADLGGVTVEDDTATVDWTARWTLTAAPEWSYEGELRLREGDDAWEVVAEPAMVHPELGEGQHLELARSLPERAPITDADGTPLFAETEVVNVGVAKGQETDLPALANALAAATGTDSAKIVSDVQAAPDGQFVPVITLRRPDFERIRAQVFDLPGAVFPTDTRPLAPSPRFAEALLGRVGGATAEIIEETTEDGVARYTAGDEVGLSGLQRALQDQLAGTAGFTVSVVSTDEGTSDTGREIAAVESVPGEAVRTPLVRGIQEAGDAAVAGESRPTHLVVLTGDVGRGRVTTRSD